MREAQPDLKESAPAYPKYCTPDLLLSALGSISVELRTAVGDVKHLVSKDLIEHGDALGILVQDARVDIKLLYSIPLFAIE